MKGTLVLTSILIIYLSQIAVQSQYYSEILPYDPEPVKVTNLHFYLHETLNGQNPTAVNIAQANITNNSSVPFATLAVVDDILKIGPEDNSEVIGNAQGLGLLLAGNTTTGVMYSDFGFTAGKFNGSSISIFSRNTIIEPGREVAVVGGRGKCMETKWTLVCLIPWHLTCLLLLNISWSYFNSPENYSDHS